MRRWISFFALIAAFTLATWLGWWGVLVVGGLWGILRPRVNAPAGTAACAAAVSWALWLLYDRISADGRFEVLSSRLAGLLSLPAPALYVLTLLFGTLLAWSVAALAGGVMDLLLPRKG